jgi:hypothetical protein
MTEHHDFDLVVFASSALQRYVLEHADVDLLKAKFGSDIVAVRNKVVEAALPFGTCRIASETRDLRLYFKDLKYDEFVRLDDLSVDTDALQAIVISRSNSPCTLTDLKRAVSIEMAKSHDSYQVVNGHDVAGVLGLAFRKLLAARRIAQTWASEIEAGLRLAFDWEALIETGVGCN